jgi:hypothetical protein
MSIIDATVADTYRYLNFDELPDFVKEKLQEDHGNQSQ